MSQEGTLLSRTLKPIPNVAIREVLQQYPLLDGELIVGDPTDKLCYNTTVSQVMRINGSTENMIFYVFDYLDMDIGYVRRLELLRSLSLPPCIKVLPQTLINNPEQLFTYYEGNIVLGYEGAILRNPNALLKQGRSTAKSQDMLKLKPFLDSEAVVLECVEGQTNNNPEFTNELGRTARSTCMGGLEGNGMLGSFIVQMGEKIFSIAAGHLTHKEREYILTHKEGFVGRPCTFRHLTVGAKDVPRHGRFMRWRDNLEMGV